MEQSFLKLGGSISVYDPDLQKQVIAHTTDKPRPENTGNEVEDSVNKLCNKITMIGHACAVNFNGNKLIDEKMNKWDGEFPKKVNKEYVKKKVDKLKKKDHEEVPLKYLVCLMKLKN